MRRLILAWLLVLGAAAAAGAAPEPAALYARWCAACHGASGRGDGPAAGMLSPRPRDFTAGVYKFRSTPSRSLPALADVVRTIEAGLPGTSMPAFSDLLRRPQTEALARFVLGQAPAGARPAPAISLGPAPPDTAAARLRGRALYAKMGCIECHGPEGRLGRRAPDGGPGQASPPADLSKPWEFRGGRAPADGARRILTGIDGSVMPAHAGRLAPAQAWEIAYHVASLARLPIWEEDDATRIRSQGVATDPVERGRYLVAAMQCPLCHTPISPESGAYDTSRFLAGGMRVSAWPWGVWYSRNLTADEQTGLGRWTIEDIVAAVRRGVGPDGRRLHPMAMPWPWFSRLTEADARAIAVFLKQVPANQNPVPSPEDIAGVEAVGGKILVALGRPAAVEFWGGNAATDPALRGHIPATDGDRTRAQVLGWLTLALALLPAIFAIDRRARRWPRLALSAMALGGWLLLAAWPPATLTTPSATIAWLFLGAPTLPDALAARDQALAERGQYLVTVAPCGLCHTPAGAFVGFLTARTLAGGMEGRWRVYGRVVSTNLTPHPRDGIAGVTDEALLRALRSGIGRDGRLMHWQAMSWDLTANWSEEDLRAMIAYLRRLPPVAGGLPPPRGPLAGDPPADVFFFGDAARGR